jgi:hypothetical protein
LFLLGFFFFFFWGDWGGGGGGLLALVWCLYTSCVHPVYIGVPYAFYNIFNYLSKKKKKLSFHYKTIWLCLDIYEENEM